MVLYLLPWPNNTATARKKRPMNTRLKKHKAIDDETHEEKHKEQITHWHTETPQSCQPRPERLEPIHTEMHSEETQLQHEEMHRDTMSPCAHNPQPEPMKHTVTTSRTNRDRPIPVTRATRGSASQLHPNSSLDPGLEASYFCSQELERYLLN